MTRWPPDKRIRIREASMADLEDITTTAQEGFPDDPEFNYRFPDRDKFPQDNRKWVRQEYTEYLKQPSKYAVMVATASDNDDRVVALSVWDKAVLVPHKGGDLGVPADPNEPPARRDVNPVHFRAFAQRMDQSFHQYFASYGEQQMHLWLLATHPSFRRRGAGSRLCQWGLGQAAGKGIHTTVLASAMGRRLYQELGFALNGSFIIRVDDETDHLELWALTHDPPSSPAWGWSCDIM